MRRGGAATPHHVAGSGSLTRQDYETFVFVSAGADSEYGLTAYDLSRVYCELSLGDLEVFATRGPEITRATGLMTAAAPPA